MKIIQIILNDKIIINLQSLSSNVILTPLEEKYLVHFFGVDEGKNKLQWMTQELRTGDSIEIRVTNSQESTPPIKIRPRDLEDIKERYLLLQSELKKKGVI